MSENIIIIPIYNDWKSLNKLLLEINRSINNSDIYKILIVDDCSTIDCSIEYKNLDKIQEIKILSLKKNLGSQKSISIALNYLKNLKENLYITIMDGDGEDNPLEIEQMINVAKLNSEYVVTSHRKDRNENFFIKFSYKVHLLISFILTWQWVSFGNFSSFSSNNLTKLNLNDVWYAHSAGVLKNCKIKKLYASRQKRYFENSKVNFVQLIEHSFRIISVFYKRVLINSMLAMFLIWIFPSKLDLIFYILIFLLNLIITFVKIKNYKNASIDLNSYIKKVRVL